MEQKIKEKKGVLKENEKHGTVKLADEVVAAIAAIAATEVEGVYGMAGNMTNELLSKVGFAAQRGARVEVKGKEVKVDLAIIMEYGYNIPSTCQYVQNRVVNAIENMTGLKVVDVNVRIAEINVNNK